MAESDLLAAILADPDDDHVRQVYADALLARGDSRGELIVVQLQLSGMPDDAPGWLALKQREQELLIAHEVRVAGAAPFPVTGGYRHGMLASLRGLASDVLRVAEERLADEPLIELDLHGCEDTDLVALQSSPVTRQLRSLVIDGSDPDSLVQVEPLSRAPLDRLDALSFRALSIADRVDRLGDTSLLTRMRSLSFEVASLVPDDLANLLGNELPRLETLVLGACQPAGLAGSVLARHPRLPSLRHLDLSHGAIDDDTLAELAVAFPALETLAVIQNGLIDQGVEAAAHALPRLRTLQLEGNDVWPRGISAVAHGCPGLENLDVTIRPGVLAALAAAPFASLRSLELAQTMDGLPRSHLAELATARWPALRHLRLNSLTLDGANGRVLAEAPAFRDLTMLKLIDVTVFDDGLVEALAGGSWPRLHTLHLSLTKITDRAAFALAASSGLPASMLRLDVRHTQIGKAGLAALRERFGHAVVT